MNVEALASLNEMFLEIEMPLLIPQRTYVDV
jgi:hypothetical protein